MAKNPTQDNGTPKFCFVVSPIGSPGSPERKRSNGFLREVIEPVAIKAGYRVERADHDKGPGMVTESIVNKLIDADLVIADLHGPNPNVMYEVAIRHATGAPIIQMMPEGEALPFDIGGLNTILYDPDVDGLEKWRADLRAAIEKVEDGGGGDNPVSRAGFYRALAQRPESDEKAIGMEIIRQLQVLQTTLLSGQVTLPQAFFFNPTGHRAAIGISTQTLDQALLHTRAFAAGLRAELSQPDYEGLSTVRITASAPNEIEVAAADGRATTVHINPNLTFDEHLQVWTEEIERWLLNSEA